MSEAIHIPLPDTDAVGEAVTRIERGEVRVILTRDGKPVAAGVRVAHRRDVHR